MKILAIDTSSKNATVSIAENEENLIEINNNDEKTHSQKLMPMIDEALNKTNLSLDEIDLIACSLGPRVLHWCKNWNCYCKSIL